MKLPGDAPRLVHRWLQRVSPRRPQVASESSADIFIHPTRAAGLGLAAVIGRHMCWRHPLSGQPGLCGHFYPWQPFWVSLASTYRTWPAWSCMPPAVTGGICRRRLRRYKVLRLLAPRHAHAGGLILELARTPSPSAGCWDKKVTGASIFIIPTAQARIGSAPGWLRSENALSAGLVCGLEPGFDLDWKVLVYSQALSLAAAGYCAAKGEGDGNHRSARASTIPGSAQLSAGRFTRRLDLARLFARPGVNSKIFAEPLQEYPLAGSGADAWGGYLNSASVTLMRLKCNWMAAIPALTGFVARWRCG